MILFSSNSQVELLGILFRHTAVAFHRSKIIADQNGVFTIMLYFGYDVPTCGSRVPFVYIGAWLSSVHTYDVIVYFLYGVEDGVDTPFWSAMIFGRRNATAL